MRIALSLIALVFLPGVPLAALFVRRIRDGLGWSALAGTLGLLWSVAGTFVLTAARVPLSAPLLLVASLLPALVVLLHPRARQLARETVSTLSISPVAAVVVALTAVVLAYPFLTVQRGLPTGDVQKAIFWAERIRATNRLPDYTEALAFNRDPGDFATPGLHTLTAAVIELSGDPYRGPAWFSLLAALLLAGLAAAFASLLTPSWYGRTGAVPSQKAPAGSVPSPEGRRSPERAWFPASGGESEGDRRSERSALGGANGPAGGWAERKAGLRTQHLFSLLSFLFAATNLRFLRYTVAPGYHYQNLLGELLLLFAFLLLLSAVGGRGGQRMVLLAGITALALPLVHQFSAFQGVFLLSIIFTVLLVTYRGEAATMFAHLAPRWRKLLLATLVAAGATAGIALAVSPLPRKLPDLFTASPHLRPYVIPLSSLPELLGTPFILLSLVGLLVAIVQLRRRDIEWRWGLLLLWVLLLFALSQGARWFIDIPSARTLFYLTTPLAIFAALAVANAVNRARVLWPRAAPALVPAAFALALAPTAGATLNATLMDIDHSRRADSTLTPATLDLLSFLSSHPPTCPAATNIKEGNENEQPAGSVPSPGGRGATSGHGPVAPGGDRERGAIRSESRSLGGTNGRSAGWAERKAGCADGILIDDWNRRRTTWAILSPYRMLTRVGADIAVLAREADQSDVRRRQYEALLDFEKIFALGNSPAILPLLQHHGIALVVSAQGLSSDVFAWNPALEVAFDNEEVTVYRRREGGFGSGKEERERVDTLLNRLTLANDIGDSEDVYAHLPVALLAPRISDVIREGGRTYRDVESHVSAVSLNVGTYVSTPWDVDGNRVIDAPVDMTLHVLGNGARGRITRGTTVFGEFTLPRDGALHTVRAIVPVGALPIDEQGLAFLTLRLDEGPLRVDLITAGLSDESQ